jgi:hypothetical protein
MQVPWFFFLHLLIQFIWRVPGDQQLNKPPRCCWSSEHSFRNTLWSTSQCDTRPTSSMATSLLPVTRGSWFYRWDDFKWESSDLRPIAPGGFWDPWLESFCFRDIQHLALKKNVWSCNPTQWVHVFMSAKANKHKQEVRVWRVDYRKPLRTGHSKVRCSSPAFPTLAQPQKQNSCFS